MQAGTRQGLRSLGLSTFLALTAFGLCAVLVVQTGLKGSTRGSAQVIDIVATALVLALAWGWWSGFSDAGGHAGTFALWALAFIGFVPDRPDLPLVLLLFLLPWLLLVVAMPTRHRLQLLVVQWLTSVLFLQTVTQSTASTVAILVLSLAHLVLVWTGLRGTRLAVVPLGVGAVLGLASLATAVSFLALAPSWGRVGATLASLAILAGVAGLQMGKLLRHFRLPELVPLRAPRPSPRA